MFKVKLNKQPFKFIQKLDKNISEKILEKLKLLKNNPFHYLEHFEGESYYKFRIGEYRALIDIDLESKILKIRVLEHRKKIYKKK